MSLPHNIALPDMTPMTAQLTQELDNIIMGAELTLEADKIGGTVTCKIRYHYTKQKARGQPSHGCIKGFLLYSRSGVLHAK
jgi:hypothetical protein